MRKYSADYGMMWLCSFASGDGSISLKWVRDSNRSETVDEYVTVSDASEFLKEWNSGKSYPDTDDWDVLDLGHVSPCVRLVRNVERPKGTSKKLVMSGKTYVIKKWGGFVELKSKCDVNGDVADSLNFFLRHEQAFKDREIRRRS